MMKRSAHSHHVVYEQELDNRGLPKFDRRNLMALCVDCHLGHHNGPPENQIPVSLLSDGNLEYAFEMLGPYAYDYVLKHYSGFDSRLVDHMDRLKA